MNVYFVNLAVLKSGNDPVSSAHSENMSGNVELDLNKMNLENQEKA